VVLVVGLFAAASVVLLVRFDRSVADELVALDAEAELLSKHVGAVGPGASSGMMLRANSEHVCLVYENDAGIHASF
jgi:hypothetical protein